MNNKVDIVHLESIKAFHVYTIHYFMNQRYISLHLQLTIIIKNQLISITNNLFCVYKFSDHMQRFYYMEILCVSEIFFNEP